MTHISYKTSKALKEFLQESAPEPMGGMFYAGKVGPVSPLEIEVSGVNPETTPAYQLHDLLSKPFCEAMAKIVVWSHSNDRPEYKSMCILTSLSKIYYDNGLPAVEAELMRLMGKEE